MSLWKKPKPVDGPPPVDPAVERQRMLRRQQWKMLQQHLADNPLFRQTTFDGMFWIDPFSAKKIDAPFDWKSTAQEYFAQSSHWRKGKTLPLAELQLVKWQHHLNEQFWNDERFRLFTPDGSWFNPFSRKAQPSIRRAGSVISPAMISMIARSLATLPQADPSRLPPLEQLLARHPELAAQTEVEEHQEVSIEGADFSLPAAVPSQEIRRNETPIEETYAPTAAEDSPEAFFGTAAVAPPVGEHAGVAADSPAGKEPDTDFDGLGEVVHDTQGDLEMAARVQQQLLGEIPDIPHLDIALHHEACHYVAGDFYNFIPLKDGRWFILLGDVSGHGVQAALVVQNIIKTLRFVCQYAERPDVVEILAALNDSIKGDLLSGQFFTCFACIVDVQAPDRVLLQTLCCGHHASIVTNAYGPVFMRSVGVRGMAVGLSSGSMLRKVSKMAEVVLNPGDTLFVWTDGLSEAMNEEQEEFGDWRTRAACLAHADCDIQDQVTYLVEYVMGFCGGLRQDDMSVLALRVPHPDDPIPEEEP